MTRKRVGILVFPNVEVLDFCGPFEVFSVTRMNEDARREEPSPFEVLLVAETAEPVTATGGLRVIPDVTTATCPPLDVLVVPGGWGTRSEINNERLVAWIAERGKKVETLTSVCTGSMLLGQAGLLDGRHATTHWRALPWMRESFPTVTVEEKLHVVEDGHVLTSAGISAGIDMALRVVARYHGEDVARATARNMEYRYVPEDNSPPGLHFCHPGKQNEKYLPTAARDHRINGRERAPDPAGNCVVAQRGGVCEGERGRCGLRRGAVHVGVHQRHAAQGSPGPNLVFGCLAVPAILFVAMLVSLFLPGAKIFVPLLGAGGGSVVWLV